MIWGGFIIVVGLFLVNLLVARPGGVSRHQGLPTGSTFSSDANGAELTYNLFEKLGFRVFRHRRLLLENTMPRGGADIIWHVRGTVAVDNDEIKWVDSWVGSGGTLVIVDNPNIFSAATQDPFAPESNDELIAHWFEMLDITGGMREARPIADKGGLSAIPHRMPVTTSREWELGETHEIHTYLRRGLMSPMVYRLSLNEDSEKGTRRVIRDGYGTILAGARYGAGQVWVVADPYLFGNLLVQEADNAVIAASMVVGSSGGEHSAVLFDEYHLGFVQSRTLADAARTPLGKGLLFLGAIAALALGIAGARFGPVRKAPGAIGVSQRAFVQALAELWLGAGATTAAADALWMRYGSRQSVRRRNLDQELDRMRKGRPRVDELIEISKKLDS